MRPSIVVIGVGNRFRRDDGVGPAVIDVVADERPDGVELIESDGDPARLIDMWSGADLAVVVEAVRHGRPPGTVVDLDMTGRFAGDTAATPAGGSHALGLAEAIALGRVTERMPRRLRLVGVEPAALEYGVGLTAPVARSVDTMARVVLGHVRAAEGR